LNRIELANKVSDIFNPLHTAPVFLLIVSIYAAKSLMYGLALWAVTSFFLSVIPLIDIKRRLQSGEISDNHITKREDRLVPFLVSLLSAVGALISVYLLEAPGLVKAVVWSVVVTGAIITLITLRWKISLHAAGITAIAVTLMIVFGLIALPVFGFIPIVFWARLTLNKHTLTQLIAGSMLAGLVVCLTLKAFGVF
jgi:membrane-associated phospholipid phosphatase